MIDRELLAKVLDATEKQENENRIPKNLVEVQFDSGVKLSYFSDLPEMKEGDLVRVEGKMEDDLAVVTRVLTSFKKPKFDMKWIAEKLNRDVSGRYFTLGGDVVSLQHTLTVQKFINLFVCRPYKENPAYGEDNLSLCLQNLEKSPLFENEIVKLKGYSLYKEERVPFIFLKNGVGKALVRGSQWYEIDFRYQNGTITYLACDCPYFGECKHLYAFLLKLRDFMQKFTKKHQTDSFVLCKKQCFNAILSSAQGDIQLDF